MKRSARSGFTLIEILIVVGIIGILVVVLLAALLAAQSKGLESTADNFVKVVIPEAMKKWQDENGKDDSTYPNSPDMTDGDGYKRGNIELFKELVTDAKDKGKDAFVVDTSYIKGEEGGKGVFLDPWNQPYIYRNYSSKKSATGKNRAYSGRRYNENTYDIISMGADGRLYENDSGDNDDVYNAP